MAFSGQTFFTNDAAAGVSTNGTQTLTNKSLVDDSTSIIDNADATKQIKFDAAGTTSTATTIASSQTTNKTLTLPDATDTLVAKNTTDILTNKTISGTSNTITAVSSVGTTTTTSSIVGGASYTTITVTNTNRTIDTTTKDYFVLVSTTTTPSTITLPAPANGRFITIKDIGNLAQTNNITIARNGSEKIDNVAASILITFNSGFVTLTSDGTDWFTVSRSSSVTPFVAYTPTLGTGFGTTTSVSFFQKRIGDQLVVQGSFTMGTVSAVLSSISLPSGLSLDTAKLSLNNSSANPGQVVGTFSATGANAYGNAVTAPSTSTSLVYLSTNINAAAHNTPDITSDNLSTGQNISINFTVPISGWGIY